MGQLCLFTDYLASGRLVGRRRHVVWQHRHDTTIAARAAATALAIHRRGGMTVAEVALMWGMSKRGARRLLESMSGAEGIPLLAVDGVWRLIEG